MLNAKSLLIICFLVLCFAIMKAPASLIERMVNNESQNLIQFSSPTGTLWQGTGIINSPDAAISWSLPLLDILKLKPKILWNIESPTLILDGESVILMGEIETSAKGKIASGQLNKIFAPYDILLGGDLLIKTISITNKLNENFLITKLTGDLHWTGGPVSYVLSKTSVTVTSPIFQLKLSNQIRGVIQATLNSPNYDYPLMKARLEPRGSLKIQVSKGFTKIFGNEWPGRESDDQFILELEEQIF